MQLCTPLLLCSAVAATQLQVLRIDKPCNTFGCRLKHAVPFQFGHEKTVLRCWYGGGF
jgi:hypothetical protein